MDMENKGMMSSATDEWETPQDLFDRLNWIYDFDLDVCATNENKKCVYWYTKEDDGLSRDWRDDGRIAWMNPPYGREIGKWVEKAVVESRDSDMTVVCLLPARTDTAWFHDWVAGKAEITFLRGRLKFGGCKNCAPFPSMIAVYRPSINLNGWTP